ncbi:MAG: DNA replication/repair protein RecF [Ignavibacteria bacterium]
MLLNRIHLFNFRNYDEQQINFNKSFNYLYGNNGEGKTNILEAISFISFGKSFLNSSESDCVKFDTSAFDVDGVYENEVGTEYNVHLNYDSILKKKTFHLNKEKVTRWSNDIFGRFPVVFLSPHSLEITYGNPSERRKFFDILLAQTSRVYLDFLRNYVRILKQKNALLKNQLNGNAMPGKEFRNLLNSVNEKMVEYASAILMRRFELLNKFKGYFTESYSFLTQKDDVPNIKYYCDFFDTDKYIQNEEVITDIEEVQKAMKEVIERKQAEEMARGVSVVGPHKDDYIFRLTKNTNKTFELKNFASQGEHKTFVIALKLAEYHFLKDNLENAPLLLLDDLLSELDSERVSKIISHLKNYGQIFLTTTGTGYSKELKDFYDDESINYFKIENGKVVD